MQFVPLSFVPDLDTDWNTNPGAVRIMYGFAPMSNGAFATVHKSDYLSNALTGSDILTAYMFRQTDGTVRLIVGRKQNLDEYTTSGGGTRTNQGTGYSSSTTDWSMAAWGNQIIATNYLDAVQSSTGTTFGSLSGSPPKARFVASNLDHVMLADVDDGGSNVYSDMVWWSALQDPSTWTPAIGGEQGRIRLLQAPGPIRALMPFQNGFAVFKDNALIIGRYVGPPNVFAWTLVSQKVGCVGSKAVTELDGKLYFAHTSGFWEFDGQSLNNIGVPCQQTFLAEYGYATAISTDLGLIAGSTGRALNTVQAASDDLRHIVWFRGASFVSSTSVENSFLYGYNPLCQKWARWDDSTSSGAASPAALVRASSADVQAYSANTAANLLMVYNDSSTKLKAIGYPGATNVGANSVAAQLTTGIIGSKDGSARVSRVHVGRAFGSQSSALSGTLAMGLYHSGNYFEGSTSATGSLNSEFDCFDVNADSRYRTVNYTLGANETQVMASLGLEWAPPNKR